MPTVDFTTPGNYNWTVPAYVSQITVTAIGGGGSGFSDNDGNFVGGGGGGGGMTKGTYSVTAGVIYSLVVGAGGSVVTDGSSSGGASSIPALGIVAGGGRGGSQSRAGGVAQGGTGGQNYPGQPGVGEDDDYRGGRGGNSSCNADYAYRGGAGGAAGGGSDCGYILVECSNFFGSGVYIARFSGRGGKGRNLDTSATGCPSDWNPSNGYGGGGGGTGNGNNNTTGYGGNGAMRIEYQFDPPTITDFYASPNPQTSGTDGIPNYNTRINWAVQNAESLVLTSGAGESWNVSGTFRDITNLPQSTGSGATRTYRLAATNPGGTTLSDIITVTVYNDRTPSNSWTTSFTNLEEKLEIPKQLGTLSGIDMITEVSCPDDAVFFASSENGDYNNPQYFTNGQQVWIKMYSLPFNTDVSGLTGNFGRTNTKTVSVTVGGLSPFDVSYVTRAPRINESFDYDGQIGQYPEPDIDLLPNNPSSTLVTQTLNMDNIEIDMEIKTDDPNVQIKINNGSWQNIQEI